MGAARLLAKAWVLFCLFAAAHAVLGAVTRGGHALPQIGLIAGCTLIFCAMGLLFAGGFGVSGRHGAASWLAALEARDFLPHFDDWVFLGFVVLSFLDQLMFASGHIVNGVFPALDNFIRVIVPGQKALEIAVNACNPGNGPMYASSFTWLIAAIFLGSAASRIEAQVDAVRQERIEYPEILGPNVLAALLGLLSIICIQLLYVGTAYAWLPCSAFTNVTGGLLLGLAPLMLAYLMIAALTCLFATVQMTDK